MVGKLLIVVFSAWSVVMSAQIAVDFTADRQTGCGIFQANFTDLSTSQNGTIVSWQWNLGGQTSMLQHPGRIFNEPGSYQICLTVTDDQGNTGMACRDSYIIVHGIPEVSFDATPVAGCAPLEVSFTDNSQSPNGDIVERIWGLGGTAGVVMLPGHVDSVKSTYDLADLYTVSLTVRDEKGCINTQSVADMITVGGIPPYAVELSDSFSCTAPLSVTMTLTGTQPGIEYVWDFGNGNTYTGTTPPLQQYDQIGQYDIRVVAIDAAAACSDTLILDGAIDVGLPMLPQADATDVCLGTPVYFSDSTDTPGATYLWSFGDGNTSTEQFPSHAYGAPGCFTVILTKSALGCSRSTQLVECVRVVAIPDMQLVADKTATCMLPAEFNLQGSSSTLGSFEWQVADGAILSSNAITITSDTTGSIPVLLTGRASAGCAVEIRDTLFIGDLDVQIPPILALGCIPVSGNLSGTVRDGFTIDAWDWTLHTSPSQTLSGNNTLFTLNQPGAFDVSLVVTSSEGCVDSIRVADLMAGGVPPEFSFSATPLVTCADTAVEFFATVHNGEADEFLWEFGDGTTGFNQNTVHEYIDTGAFTVILTAISHGCPSTDSIVDYVYIYPPIAKFTDTLMCATDTVIYTSTSIGADSLQWTWSRDSVLLEVRSDSIARFALESPGMYIATLTVWNDTTGCVADRRDTIIWNEVVKDVRPEPMSGCAPLTVNVQDYSSGITSWLWTAPGGEISDTAIAAPEIVFSEPGQYADISVITEDLNGCIDTLRLPDTVTANRITPHIAMSDFIVCEGSLVTLRDSSESLFGQIISWEWLVGEQVMSSLDTTMLALDSSGVYDIRLMVRDEYGCTADTTLSDTLVVVSPDFTPGFDSLSCPGAETIFRVPGSLPHVKYNWDYGDGWTAVGRVVSHIYADVGKYPVCVSIANAPGCTEVVCDTITIVDPVAAFAADTLFSNCPPLVVNFENQSDNATMYFWDFGDQSGASVLEDPAHVYTRPGVFDVQLIAGFGTQCFDTLVKEEYIMLEGPEGEFQFEVDGTCAPVEAAFVGTSIDLYDYIWDFGNGILDSSEVRVMTDSIDHMYDIPGAYVPRLILIDTENCLRSFTSDTIFVRESIEVEATGPPFICIGDSVILQAELDKQVAGMLFSWTADEPLECTTCLVAVSRPESSTLYSFAVEHPNGCVSSDSLYVEVKPLPQVSASALDSVQCFDAEVRLFAETDPSNEIQWTIPFTASCDDCADPVLPDGSEGTFAVMVRDTFGCASADSVTVEIFRDTVDFLIDDRTICSGDTTIISLDGVTDPIWTGTTMLSCFDCTTTAAFPQDDVMIAVSALHPAGCRVNDTLSIHVLTPDMIEAGTDQEICAGEIIALAGVSPDGSGSWTPVMPIIGVNGQEVSVAPDTTTIFTYAAQIDECILRDSLNVSVLYKAAISASGDAVCPGDTALIIADGNAETYQWYDHGGALLLSDSIPRLRVRSEQTETFYVVGYRSVCEPDTATAEVFVHRQIAVDLPEERVVYPGEIIPFDLPLASSADYDVAWSPSQIFDCADCPSTTVVADSTREISVFVTDLVSGCVATDTSLLLVPRRCLEEFVHVPNVFSPNGDGVNDVLPLFSSKHQEIRSFQIFDRWGDLLFQTDRLDEHWDGTVAGRQMPAGVYVYLLQLPCVIDGSILTLAGDITLVR